MSSNPPSNRDMPPFIDDNSCVTLSLEDIVDLRAWPWHSEANLPPLGATSPTAYNTYLPCDLEYTLYPTEPLVDQLDFSYFDILADCQPLEAYHTTSGCQSSSDCTPTADEQLQLLYSSVQSEYTGLDLLPEQLVVAPEPDLSALAPSEWLSVAPNGQYAPPALSIIAPETYPSSTPNASDPPTPELIEDAYANADASDSSSDCTPSEWDCSPRLPPLNQRGAYRRARAQSSSTVSSRPSGSRISSPVSESSTRRPIKRRQTGLPGTPHEHRPRVASSRSVQLPLEEVPPEPVDYNCPICPHYQRNHRKPDLRRHIKSHYAQARRDWVCCGVPLDEADRYGVRQSMQKEAQFWEETGRVMVGGCGLEFARKDAYKRHLTKCIHTCYGDVNREWVRGNACRVPA